jgi:hypothetical protein
MRNLLAFLAAAALTFAGVGWYLGWYKVRSQPAADGHRAVNIEFNTVKIGADIEKGEHKLHEVLEKSRQNGDGNAKPAAPPAEVKDKDKQPAPHSAAPQNPAEAAPVVIPSVPGPR